MRRSRYLLGPVVALGIGTGCDVKQTPAQAISEVEAVAPGADCEHGGMRFIYADAAKAKKLVCKDKVVVHEAGGPAGTLQGKPTEKLVLPEWPGDLIMDDQHPTHVAAGNCVARVTGNLTYSFNGPTTVYLPHLEEVAGDVTLQGGNATDLQGLRALRHIGGALRISGTKLASIHDLNLLENVEKGIVIDDNAALETITGFKALGAAHGIVLANNAALTKMSGFFYLADAEGEIHISDNPMLKDLAGLANLKKATSLRVHNNAALTNLFFMMLGEVTGDVEIDENAALVDFESMPALTHVGGNFSVHDNEKLESLKLTLQEVKGQVAVEDNPALQMLNLSTLADVGAWSVRGNPAMKDIHLSTEHAPRLNGVDIVTKPAAPAAGATPGTKPSVKRKGK